MTTPADQKSAAFAAWFRSAHNQIAALVALAIIVAGFVLAPESKLDKLGHALVAFGSTTPGAMIYAALGALAVAVLRWALSVVPKGAASGLVLVLALGAATVGCGAQLTASQREALAVETQRCAAREMEIANNPCGDLSPEQCRARDDADQAAEQTRCDAARAAIVGGAP